MMLNLERRSQYKIKVDVTDDDGNTILRKLVNIYSEKDIQWLIKLNPKWSVGEINGIVGQLCDTPADGQLQPMVGYDDYTPPKSLIESLKQVETVGDSEEQKTEPFVIHLREINQLKKYSTVYQNVDVAECLKDVLTNPLENSVEPLIEWTQRDKLCCLDIDYHTVPLENRPTLEQLKNLVSSIKPQPYCWHPSHGRGCKLYYLSTPIFTATELASVAGLQWVQNDPRSSFDLSSTTRHPRFRRSRDNAENPVNPTSGCYFVYGSGDVSDLRRILNSEVDQTDIDEYLNSRGWTFGQTLPHSQCPIDPGNSSDEHKQNVYIGEGGVYCHRCYGRGLGTSGPGFASYASLIGSNNDNRLKVMVKNFCHLEHAKIVLETMYPNVPLKVLETIYKVLMKIVHSPDDPRIRIAMTAGKGFIRSNGTWVAIDGTNVLANNIINFVRSLPATMIPKSGDEEDGFHTNVSTSTAFLNAVDLEEYGYPNISFLRGCKIYGQFIPYKDNEIVKIVIKKKFDKCKPEYVPLSKRMQPDEYWGLIESEFPGLDKNYVRLLLAAKGASEGRLAQCPFLLVTGPAGSGKSTTPAIAAGICGDTSSQPIWVPHIDRFRQSLMDASRDSGFVVVDEVFKYADRARLSATQALDPMLSLTEDSRSHVMYVGSVPFGRLPVFVLTDINIPREVESDIQLSRRFTFYRLTRQNFWTDNLVKNRIQPNEFRLISADHKLAADCILSEVIDSYFRFPMPLTQIAAHLGIQSLEEYSEDIDNTADMMKRFYEEVCKAPLLEGTDATRYKPQWGWKRIDRIHESTLSNVWGDLCDGQLPETWIRSRAIESADWSKIVGTPFAIQCEIRPYKGVTVYVRFRSCDSPKTPKWVNGKDLK